MNHSRILPLLCALIIGTAVNAKDINAGAEHPRVHQAPKLLQKPNSKPLVRVKIPVSVSTRRPKSVTSAGVTSQVLAAAVTPANTTGSVQMQVLVLTGTTDEISFQSITTFLDQIGVPYKSVVLSNVTPDASGNRLTGIPFVDSTTGYGLYQGIILADSGPYGCTPSCGPLLSTADWTILNNYASQYQVREVTYYTYPDPAWGLEPADSGASYLDTAPLNVTLTDAGAAVFSYLNRANPVPISGENGGGIWAYQATTTAAAGETTTPLLTVGSNTVAVTHTTADGRQTLSLTMDNYPTLLHSVELGYGVINWVTKGVFLGARQVYLNPEIDDLFIGNWLYAPTQQPQCQNTDSCPTVFTQASDLSTLSTWQTNHQRDPQLQQFQATLAFVGVGVSYYAPDDPLIVTAKSLSSQFGWITHSYDHPNFDCYSLTDGVCNPATLTESFYELDQNLSTAATLGLGTTFDVNAMVTPFNGGLGNPNFISAAKARGLANIIDTQVPPGPMLGVVNPISPYVLEVPRFSPNLFDDVDNPLTGVYGSWPDEYNQLYGPSGTNPLYSQNQTYSQILDNESTAIVRMNLLSYGPYPLAFHISNMSLYDSSHSMYSDLMDAVISKYEAMFNLPVTTRPLREIGSLLADRASYDASGVKGVYTPGIGVTLTATNGGVVRITGACSQLTCPAYAGQIQDRVSMAANSVLSLSLTAGQRVELSSVSLSAGTLTGGDPLSGRVVLSGPAPTGGVLIPLSSNSGLLKVPATVTVPAGSSVATFAVTTTATATAVTAVVSGSYNDLSQSISIDLVPAVSISSVTINPSTVAGGNSTTGTVNLSAPALKALTVTLSSNSGSATVSSPISFEAGDSSASFTVNTAAVASTATATISATYSGTTKTAQLTITGTSAVTLSSVSLNPTSVAGGATSTGTVTLSGAAPSGGTTVTLSSNSGQATVPASVTVAAGASTATFTVNTTTGTSTAIATISATYGGTTKTAQLTVTGTPAVTLSSVSLNPTSVAGGATSTGTVTLSGAAPSGGTTVTLSSNSGQATVPASVTVVAGASAATFTVNTTTGTSTGTATISATYSGTTKTAQLTITGTLAVTLSSVSLNPTSVAGGATSTGTVTLSGAAPSGGTTVTLSSNSGQATVPASVTVVAGASTATFTVNTTTGTSTATATISATYGGTTKTAQLTVTGTPAVTLSSVSLNPTSVKAGGKSTGTVALSAPAPAGGLKVTLSNNDILLASTPSSVTVAAGATSASFTVSTRTLFTGKVEISAKYNSVTKTAQLSVTR